MAQREAAERLDGFFEWASWLPFGKCCHSDSSYNPESMGKRMSRPNRTIL